MAGRTRRLLARDRSVAIGRHGIARRDGDRMRTYHLQALGIVARFLKNRSR
jgi:hypothetical protein